MWSTPNIWHELSTTGSTPDPMGLELLHKHTVRFRSVTVKEPLKKNISCTQFGASLAHNTTVCLSECGLEGHRRPSHVLGSKHVVVYGVIRMVLSFRIVGVGALCLQ